VIEKAQELTEIISACKTIFCISDIAELPAKLATADNDVFQAFSDSVDLDSEPIQKIFQYWMADRKEAKQDFTPPSLANLIARLAGNEKSIYDCCAGCGSLTVAAKRINPKAEFVCDEKDNAVMPFLLFNLALHNVKAVVRQTDVLGGEIIKTFISEPGEKYAAIRNI